MNTPFTAGSNLSSPQWALNTELNISESLAPSATKQQTEAVVSVPRQSLHHFHNSHLALLIGAHSTCQDSRQIFSVTLPFRRLLYGNSTVWLCIEMNCSGAVCVQSVVNTYYFTFQHLYRGNMPFHRADRKRPVTERQNKTHTPHTNTAI